MNNESPPSWVNFKCKANENLVMGRMFKTAGLAGDPEWDVMIDVAVCQDEKIARYQDHSTN